MSGFTLKLIALVLMIIDHAGLVLLAGTSWYLPCRILGRIAFPIYAFLITEGYVHTHNVKKYAGRLLAFALLSEIPFDYAFFGTFFYAKYQNVFFTLTLGLAAMVCLDMAAGKNGTELSWEQQMRRSGIGKVLLVVIMIAAEAACTDYGAFGVLMILLFYWFRNQKGTCVLVTCAALIAYGFLGGFQIEGFAALSWIFIGNYNGEKGKYPLPSIVFYAAYPIHLLILGVLVRGWFVG